MSCKMKENAFRVKSPSSGRYPPPSPDWTFEGSMLCTFAACSSCSRPIGTQARQYQLVEKSATWADFGSEGCGWMPHRSSDESRALMLPAEAPVTTSMESALVLLA